MILNSINLPPVSSKFYEKLLEVFPAISPLDINKDTSIIELQRNAAQQEVLLYIARSVRKEVEEPQSVSLWSRLMKK